MMVVEDKRAVQKLGKRLGMADRPCMVEGCDKKAITMFVNLCSHCLHLKNIPNCSGVCVVKTCRKPTNNVGIAMCWKCNQLALKALGLGRQRKTHSRARRSLHKVGKYAGTKQRGAQRWR